MAKVKEGSYAKGQRKLHKDINKDMVKAKKDRAKAYRQLFGK